MLDSVNTRAWAPLWAGARGTSTDRVLVAGQFAVYITPCPLTAVFHGDLVLIAR